MPEGLAFDHWSAVIRGLTGKYGGNFFEPHVTLIGQLTGDPAGLSREVRRLCSLIDPFSVTFSGIGTSAQFFRCIFAAACLTDELAGANGLARRIFGREKDPVFMPHLSLLYGDFPEGKRHSISLEASAFTHPGFEVRSIHIVSTSGGPEEWFRTGAVALGRRVGA